MTLTPAVMGTTWRFKPLILMHLFAVLLMFTFLNSTGYALWRELDSSIFFSLNGTLSEGGTWAWIWAWANTRQKDMLLALVMLVFLVFPGLGFQRSQLQQALVGFLAIMLVTVVLRYFFYEWAKIVDITGASPSITLSPAIMLTELFPHIPAKDSAGRSFPGDHATVLLIWAGYLLMNRVCLGSILAAFLAALMIFPRLIAGAHWFSDVAVGGFAVTLPVLAWTFYSPLVYQLTRGLAKLFYPLFRLVGKIPLIGQLPFFKGHSQQP